MLCPNCQTDVEVAGLYQIEESGKKFALCNECGQWFEISKEDDLHEHSL